MTALRQTGGYDSSAWVRASWSVVLPLVQRAVDLADAYEDTDEGRADRTALWRSIAAWVVAFAGVITGWGGLEYNDNPGLLPCPSSSSACVQFSAEYGGESMAAFATSLDGWSALLADVQHASELAWSSLESAQGIWINEYQRAISRGAVTADGAIDGFGRVVREVGDIAPLSADELADLRAQWRGASGNRARTPAQPAARRSSSGGGSGLGATGAREGLMGVLIPLGITTAAAWALGWIGGRRGRLARV